MYSPPSFLHYTNIHTQVYSTRHSKQGVTEANSKIYHICKIASRIVLLQQISHGNITVFTIIKGENFSLIHHLKTKYCVKKSHLILKQI